MTFLPFSTCQVGLDLEPNKYAKLRKQAMLAQEEQNDPMPCALLFVDQLFLKIRDMVRPGKREELLDTRPPRKMIRQIEDLEHITKSGGVGGAEDQDPYAIASAPDTGSVMPSAVTTGQTSARPPCSNLPTKLFGVFR